jgi:uncharacterized protein YoxC
MIILICLGIAAAIGTGVLLIVYLVRIIAVMRKIATTLATVRLLLRSVARQTEDVPGYVAGIHDNVETLDDAVNQLSAAVGAGRRAAP